MQIKQTAGQYNAFNVNYCKMNFNGRLTLHYCRFINEFRFNALRIERIIFDNSN